MAKKLTREEWLEIKPPLYWIDMSDFTQWRSFHYEVALKWAEKNGETWVYLSDTKFIFGSETDRFMFQMWAQESFDPEKMGDLI